MAIHRSRSRGRRALIVTAIALLAVGIVGLAAMSYEPSKPGPLLRPEGALAPLAIGNADVDARSVPARAPLPAAVTCAGGWTYFDNPVMHYGLCVPPGWGFSDFRRIQPLDRIPSVQLENLHLLGSAFPWHPGSLPFDAVRHGTLDVELDILPAAAQRSDDCEPATGRLLGALIVPTCEQLYDEAGLPAANGPLRALKVIIPLRTPPAGEPGARLLIIARSRVAASLGEVKTLWQIVQSVHAY